MLIGPNGSGKSNLLRALELIRVSAAGNLRDFVLGKGGLPRPAPQSASFRISSAMLQVRERATPRFRS
ncbi:MAG: AAA family ATPase [Bryobacteraceae bacterium]